MEFQMFTKCFSFCSLKKARSSKKLANMATLREILAMTVAISCREASLLCNFACNFVLATFALPKLISLVVPFWQLSCLRICLV